MKKLFEMPEVKMERLELEDVLTTSNCDEYNPDCPYDAGEF